jgi:SAM-dependent methyltransferase
LGYRAIGFSFAEPRFREVLSPLGYEFIRGDEGEPTALPFPDASFDAAVSVGVLEHVRELGGSEAGSLREIRRVVKPGGHFVCYHLPARLSLINFAASLVPGKHHHGFRHTRASIRGLCRESGLELVETRRYGALPRNTWGALPRRIRNSPWVARAWDTLDALLGIPLSFFCQNHYFVAANSTNAVTA